VKRYFLLAPANPQMRLLTLDMLDSPEIEYRGELTLKGTAAHGYDALPRDRSILCINSDTGYVYRPDGDKTVTSLGSILEHMLSRPVKNAVYHGDAAPLLFTTQDETALRMAMQRAGVPEQDIKDALYGKAIRLFEPTLVNIVCEAFRLVSEETVRSRKEGRIPSYGLDRILSRVSVDRSEQNQAA
jgi:hypothetical protein